jgi:hypothetical protein
MATIEINDGDSVQVIELQVPFYGVAGSELEFGARAEGAVTKGDVVFVSGATGTHIQVQKAQANSEATSAGSIGVAKNTAANNEDLQVVTFGVISNLNTQAYTEGQVLYLSAATAGAWVTTLPVAPNHGVRIGWVVRSHPSQGAIFVDVQNYQELEELSDVNVAGVTDGQVLTYQSSSGTWIPGTPNPGDITAVNVTSPITGGGTSGSVTVGINQAALSLTASQISDGSTTWARLAAANTFTVGGHLISNSAAATVPLRIRAASGQTANMLEWQNDAGAAQGWVDNTGGNLFMSSIRSRGNPTTGSFMSLSSNLVQITQQTAGAVAFVIRGATSQSANLQEWQDSAGTILTRVSSSGSILTSGRLSIGQTSTATAQANVLATQSTLVGMIVQGAAAQSANLQEWQNSAGTILARISSAGFVQSDYHTDSTNTGTYLAMTTSIARFDGRVAGTTTMAVRGAASQTADLQQWQNSGGTSLARIDSSGNLFAGISIRTLNSYGGFYEVSSGAYARLFKLTAAGPNPGADRGNLYFRDGTNAGTLKLVVRAGASGAETTILDNIPQ